MTTAASPRLIAALPPEGRDRMMQFAHEVQYRKGARIFEEGRTADRFWIIRTGSVTLDLHVPGRQAARVETLGPNDLLGWSWLFPPHTWHLGASALSPVRALEFDANATRRLCEEEPVFGQALTRCTAEIIARRLHAARTRLLDLFGPQGSGPRP
ncbi:cyclic nucleotide-binding domain-containing protein [Streptomyces sp. HNM0575]|uniref:Crp/Fnr family transcriptional regulator n=1 Tax=Streptomyces sp. HNM0575 TaxID=2716338 RepID=UPI00145EC199|nr:cyclic nucleotide-binding domain-containing protein [Streptomyces sp. HNM0575]NLU75242.1 cyclic nucleotide-binding domain-containing protein [Streptomyces sp. HNM0575]